VGVRHRRRIDSTYVLGVTTGRLDDIGVHCDRLAVALLPAATTRVAYGERDLVVGPALVIWASKRTPREEKQCRVVIEGLVSVATKVRHRFAESRERLGRDVEPEHVPLDRRVVRIVGLIPEVVSCDEIFDLTNRAPAGRFDPRTLVLARGDA